MTKEIIGIQYLRGSAAMLVVLHHLYFSDTQLGPFGVKIFFVISGFVMWLTTADRRISPTMFWHRRLIRIVPLYWLFLSLLIILVLLEPQYFNSTVINPENAFKSFLFIPHYHAVQKFIAPILIPGWSLNYEMFFYFLFGAFLLVRHQSSRAILVSIVLGGLVLLGLFFKPQNPIAVTYTSTELLQFLEGVMLGLIYRSYCTRGTFSSPALMGLGVLVCSAGSLNGQFLDLVETAPAIIVAGTLALEPHFRRATNLILHAIGDASYSIYLSHLFSLRFFELFWRHFLDSGSGGSISEAMYIAFGFVFAVAGGIAVHFLIERPMLIFFANTKVAVKAPQSERLTFK